MGLRLLSFIKLDSEGDRICFIIILTAAQCPEKCLCGNKCSVTNFVSISLELPAPADRLQHFLQKQMTESFFTVQ